MYIILIVFWFYMSETLRAGSRPTVRPAFLSEDEAAALEAARMADATRTANLAAETARAAAFEIKQMCFNTLEAARVFLVGANFPTKRLVVVEDAIFCEIPLEHGGLRTAKMVHKLPAMPTAMEEHELEPPDETIESIQFAVTAEVAMVIAQKKYAHG